MTREQDLRAFFLWLIRDAKIDVIDAEKAIEAHGFGEPFVPVLTLDELIKSYIKNHDQKSR